MARIRALLRRAGGEGDPDALQFEELRLDSARHGVVVGETFVELTRTEYQLLELLMRNPRGVVTRDVALERVWGGEGEASHNVVDRYVAYLRRKLGDPPLIHTVRGIGFRLDT